MFQQLQHRDYLGRIVLRRFCPSYAWSLPSSVIGRHGLTGPHHSGPLVMASGVGRWDYYTGLQRSEKQRGRGWGYAPRRPHRTAPMARPGQNLQELVPHPAYLRWTPSSGFLADFQTAKDVGSAMGSDIFSAVACGRLSNSRASPSINLCSCSPSNF